MDIEKALAIFTTLEKATYGWSDGLTGGTVPAYTVRLDANYANSATEDEDPRYYRLFVQPTSGHPDPHDSISYIMEVAAEHGADPQLENAGISLS